LAIAEVYHRIMQARKNHANTSSVRSKTGHSLKVFGIPITLHRDFRGRHIDFAQVVRCEFDCGRADVLIKTRQFGCSRDRNNPRLLRQQPGQRDLSRRRSFLPGDPAEQIDNRLVRL
jgi:hypothetical protein